MHFGNFLKCYVENSACLFGAIYKKAKIRADDYIEQIGLTEIWMKKFLNVAGNYQAKWNKLDGEEIKRVSFIYRLVFFYLFCIDFHFS